MAAVAELEAGLISERTKAALAQAKARGGRLGNPRLQPGTREQALHAAAAKRRQAADRAAQIRPYIEAAQKRLSRLSSVVSLFAGPTCLATLQGWRDAPP